MIYLDNTTQSQQVYIPRQVIQTATTREINYITSGDVINIVDEKLEPYYTSAETDTQIENAIATESARCEETYAKISDIPDVSDFVTSADVKSQIEDYHYITSGQAQEQINQSLSGYATEQWVEDKHYLTEHQSLSAYSTTEQMNSAISAATDDMATKTWVGEQGYLTEHQSLSAYSTTEQIEGMIANESARTEETYAKISDVPDLDNYYTSAETDTAIENAIAAEVERADSTYATPSDIPDVSEFITTGDLASYALSADVDTLVEDTIAAESARCEETYAKPDDVSSAVNELALGLAYLGVVNDVSESNGTVTITKTGLVSGEITTGLTDSFNLPDVSEFVTSADVETQITGKGYALSGDLQTLSGNVAQNAEDIYAVDNALYTEFWNSAKTSSEIDKAIDNAIRAESGRTEKTYAKIEDIPDVSNFVTSADVETQITNKNYVTSATVQTQIDGNLSAYTPTSNFATINGSAITEGGNIIIQGGSGGNANIIELTQAEYDALTAYTEDALYVITDAEEVDLNDYATSADVATINTALGNKADKVTVTPNSTARKFPYWNGNGIITGQTSDYIYNTRLQVNNTDIATVYGTYAGSKNLCYAPTTAGDSGQVVVSNGSGAPSWSSFKFWYGSQLDYDLIWPKDNTTIYFITD